MPKRLTILSSVKRLVNDQYSENQISAIKSWQDAGADVVLFNTFPDISYGMVERPYSLVSPEKDPPTIHEMLAWYLKRASRDDVVAIVNGDIILSKDAGKIGRLHSSLGNVWGITSFRHMISDGKNIGVVDQGLDLFSTTAMVADRIIKDIPQFLTLGRGGWDNWMNGWFHKNLPYSRYFDITNWGCVMHNDHDREPGRLSGYNEDQTKEFLYHPKIKAMGIPSAKLSIPI